jgi:hypothetical protein
MRNTAERTRGSNKDVQGTAKSPTTYADEARYNRNLGAFIERLQEQRGGMLKAQDSTIHDVDFTVVTGRRFDTIKQTIVRTNRKTETAFFVERSTGTIYGKKSELAVNENHWFDTIYVSRRWDWSLEFPEPKKSFRDEYTESRGYGGYKHFRAKDSKKTRAA